MFSKLLFTLLAAGTDKKPNGNSQSYILIALIVVLVVVMVVIQIFSSKKRKKQAAEFSQKLKAGSRIMTGSGIIGEIIGFDDNAGTVVLDIARTKDQKVEIVVARAAIARIIPDEAPAAKVSDSNITETSKEEEAKAAVTVTEDELEAQKKAEAKAAEKAKKAETKAKKDNTKKIVEKSEDTEKSE